MMRFSPLSLAAALSLTMLGTSADASLLGPAGGYNAFILGNYTLTNSSTEGSVAVAGNALLTGFNVDSTGHGASSALVVGGTLTATNGSINGNVAHAGAASLTGATVSGTQTVASPIDFAAAQSLYDNYSTYLAALAPTGSVLSQYGGLTLTGTSSTLNIFNLSGALLASANVFNVVVPQGSTVLINVDGATDSMSNFGFNLGTSSQNVLLNFYQATALSASGIDIQASVLAPLATFTFANGQLDGNLIAANFTGGQGSTGSLRDTPFDGTLPTADSTTPVRPIPEPSTPLMLGVGLLALAFIRWQHKPSSTRATMATAHRPSPAMAVFA